MSKAHGVLLGYFSEPHQCITPRIWWFRCDPGRIWQCNECGHQYVQGTVWGNPHWWDYETYKTITKRSTDQ